MHQPLLRSRRVLFNQYFFSRSLFNLSVWSHSLLSQRLLNKSFFNKIGALVLLCLSGPAFVIASDALTNINLAPAAELANNLPGIGPAKATAIVRYREQHGPFKTVDALVNVKGIGPGILAKIKALVAVGDSGDEEAQQPLSQLAPLKVAPSQKTVNTFAKQEPAVRHAVKAALTLARRHAAQMK